MKQLKGKFIPFGQLYVAQFHFSKKAYRDGNFGEDFPTNGTAHVQFNRNGSLYSISNKKETF